MRRERKIQGSVANKGSYQDRLLKEYRESSNQTVEIMAENVDDVELTHDEDLYMECLEVGTQIKWSFQIKTERLLSHVALLKNDKRGVFSLGLSTQGKVCTYAEGKSFAKSSLCYEVNVTFMCTSCHIGLCEQWLVFDFGMRPVLLKKIKVRVGAAMPLLKTEEGVETIAPALERWHKGNRTIIPHPRVNRAEELLEKYRLPETRVDTSGTVESLAMIRPYEYRDKMHGFLYTEERVETDIIRRLDFRGFITVSACSAAPGDFIGSLPFSHAATQGTPEGVLLKREVETVLVGLVSPEDQKPEKKKIYEALIVEEFGSEAEIHLKLSRECGSVLGLRKGQTHEVEVQFQLNRLSFLEMHKAIDLLPHLNNVLPDFTKCCLPSHFTKYPHLNGKQQAAMEFMLGDTDGQHGVAPLLIYGPFGTGKTFTLASAAKEVVCQKGGRVLICTHTNSSADIYVSRHFHQFVQNGCHDARPLRIKKSSGLNATDSITLKYCLVSQDGQFIMLPRRSDLDSHRILITTTLWAKKLCSMNLPKDYFSHILIDEASQMLECEALVALGLAGPATRVVLAGDHMQMGPRLFSVNDDTRSEHTLLNRLFYYYQSQEKELASKSRIIFTENYRSNEDIVKFVSTHFYTGKSVAIRACGDVPPHPKHYPLRFHHVRGECRLHAKSQSCYNWEETECVVKIVKDLYDQWPVQEWGVEKKEAICILTEGRQIRFIRDALKSKRLDGLVLVQSVANIQGKQFRVIVMSTVQTTDHLLASKCCLEFFNDARVLNTAMTRAQSQVIVVGDAAALCYFGKCSRTWRCYVEHCIQKGSAQPEYLTEEFLREEVEDLSRFQRPEYDVDAEEPPPPVAQDEVDPILQQMIKEYAEDNSDESDIDSESEATYASPQYSRRCGQGGLLRQPFNTSHSRRYREPSDHMLSQASNSSLVGQSFVCFLEDDFQYKMQYKEKKFIQKTMVPLRNGVKIRVLLRKPGNWLPIHQPDGEDTVHINEQMKRKHVFVVEVICWKDNCPFPLGKVIDVLPVGASVEEDEKVLDAMFKPYQLPPNLVPHPAVVVGKAIVDHRHVKTFTIDPPNAKRLDDAISIKDVDLHYEVGVHIADVVCTLENDDALYRHETEEDKRSLSPGKVRNVISLITTVDKKSGQITNKTWQLSRIKSNRKLDYEQAENILRQTSNNDLRFETVDDCIAVAYQFSQACRKERLTSRWAYSKQRDHQSAGKRRSYLMVEELNIMFNHEMSKYLLQSTESTESTPLRCQKSPEEEKLQKVKSRHERSGFMQMSANLHSQFYPKLNGLQPYKFPHTNEGLSKPFKVLKSVWSNIQQAARNKEYDRMADLIGTDDLYPQLLPTLEQLRDAQSKAYIIRSNSCGDAEVGHYSLAVGSYTWASSPLRREMDKVLQGLFHSVYSKECIQYSTKDIDELCKPFERDTQDTEERHKLQESLKLSRSLTKNIMSKLACVVFVHENEDRLKVSFPFNKGSLPQTLPLLYRDLLLDDHPMFYRDDEQQFVKLTWQKRVYLYSASGGHKQNKPERDDTACIEVQQELWHNIAVAVQCQDFIEAAKLIEVISESECGSQTVDAGGGCEYVTEYCRSLSQGDILKLQLRAERDRMCLEGPKVQLLYVSCDFVVCVEHAHQPVECFTKLAEYRTKDYYKDINEYVKVWKPLCRMVSATTAVRDSESITIDDVPITWRLRDDLLEGNFSLRKDFIKQWKIECNLAQCYLCIKKMNLKREEKQSDEMGDPQTFTWVAHGVVKGFEETERKSMKEVKFHINHRSMSIVPGGICNKASCFSVEIIPKLPPDIRTENAVNNIVKANDLVQNIALGWGLKNDNVVCIPKKTIMTLEKPRQLPPLNESQYDAVAHAINSSFTIIQGPPGTGKTVVGAYIAYWFQKLLETAVEHSDKKEVVMYCGPSHKSVDVVAEYLLKFEENLKPLRVYSRQTEMQEYPYPGSSLQLSRKSRQEKSRPQLRSITLHHRIRESGNPHSEDIKAFDERIKNGEISEDDEKEIEKYKEKLNEARAYELKSHDIILCTCTAASSANLTKALSPSFILIDECAMATEPQALIPLVSYDPKKIVLLGDHKQLRPIVANRKANMMGMSRSMFERCISTYKKAACRLNVQYRMHEDICEFPSTAYYGGTLQTMVECGPSALCIRRHGMIQPTRIVFVDIEGTESRQFISTEKGNERSVANEEECIKATKIAEELVKIGKIRQEDIAILSPYNAQVANIKAQLMQLGLLKITVNTITKSQGSEWRYVILSVVRSCPEEDIPKSPPREWNSVHIGFVGDANQINVAITRAQDGLCILGNRKLLCCSRAWKQLLQFYTKKNCLVNEDDVCVRKVSRATWCMYYTQ
ncbi:3'-5' exoribonuclease HELZ2 [Engraulis encrasicolus]|uniref:3'-5' exoribonuclease HELZ2 n=1 Tax=Engraulis encrasicolus TaxID=184585 RepID=UPI002FCEAB42